MHFLQELKVNLNTFMPSLDARHFEPLDLGNGIELSIQGSRSHYCTPRATVDPTEYSEMELAIFKDGEWARLTAESEQQLGIIGEPGDNPVYGYTPVDTIQAIRELLQANPEAAVNT